MMNNLRMQLKRPLITGLAGLVLGLMIGLPVLGWWAWPVQWTDAAPAQLRKDLQVDYLRMSVDSYLRNSDKELAQKRWKELGKPGQEALLQLQAIPGNINSQDIAQFSLVVQAAKSAVKTDQPKSTKATVVKTPSAKTTPIVQTSAGATTPSATTPWSLVLTVMCVLTLAIGGALVYLLFLRKRSKSTLVDTEDIEAPVASAPQKSPRPAQAVRQSEEAPVAQFMTSYTAGDDLYDDSFSIDAPNGEFLGECGVGISDTIGVGDPKKVTAFEVWLFDKNDIQTVTKVLMSSHAFNDSAIRQKLASKGEPLQLDAGKRILLETATLQLEVRVVDMNYGQGALPPESYIDRMTLELAIWPKSAQH